ncbi:hypothetical protein MPER_06228, partial [Moniliophthora perniciosa FA553]
MEVVFGTHSQKQRDVFGRSRFNKETADANTKKKASAPKGEFTFQYESAASTRLRIATNQVLSLRPRFETEFAKQSSSKRDKEKANVASREKDKERGRKRNRAAPPSVPPTPEKSKALPPASNTAASSPAPPPSAGGGGKKKKKKRSALANASNPHHLRNYVPSRLPHQPPSSTHISSQVQGEWALPLAFLRAGKGENEGGGESEWICAFCEYELFYGEEADLKRAVRKRKAILRRRKRARERARGVTNGTSNRVKPKAQQEEHVQDDGEGYDNEEDYDEEFDEG